jgi:hypothetical protein
MIPPKKWLVQYLPGPGAEEFVASSARVLFSLSTVAGFWDAALCPQLSVVSGFYTRKFDAICRKYVQYLCLQINLLKN